jgi:DNA polymerase III alpha subunit
VVHNSFNLAHSVSYGVVAYISMFMKRHFPREFYWAQLAHPTTKDEVAARFIGEAIRRGISFAPFSLALRGATWTLGDDGRSIVPGWMSIKGIGDAAGEELAKHAPYTDLADVEKRCNRRVVNVKIRRLIEEHLGKTVEELYGLDRWLEVDRRFPQRHQIIQVNEGMVDGQSVTVGRVTKINKKNRLEEYRTKGRDTAALVASGKPTDYVILILQDDTDSMMVYVTPENYARWHQAIWTSEGTFIKVVGQKVPGVQLVNAKAVEWNVLGQELKGVKAYTFAERATT